MAVLILKGSQALRLRRSWREAVPGHDLGHLHLVRRTTSRRVDHLGSLAEIFWTNRCRRDYAECLYVLASWILEPVNGTARNAERLARADFDLLPVDRPGQH